MYGKAELSTTYVSVPNDIDSYTVVDGNLGNQPPKVSLCKKSLG